MYRQHRLVREAIAQRAAEVSRLAAQYEEDARGDCCQPADGLVRTRRRRRLRRVSPGRSQDTVGAFLPRALVRCGTGHSMCIWVPPLNWTIIRVGVGSHRGQRWTRQTSEWRCPYDKPHEACGSCNV